MLLQHLIMLMLVNKHGQTRPTTTKATLLMGNLKEMKINIDLKTKINKHYVNQLV